MSNLGHLHKSASRMPSLRVIALVQLIIMLVLALPLCCSATEPEQTESYVGLTAGPVDAGHDTCPCCPGEDESDADNCSTCSYCSTYTSFPPSFSLSYLPAETQLVSRHGTTALLEVHIPIFVPPQNHA
jgi:hypothetical protein